MKMMIVDDDQYIVTLVRPSLKEQSWVVAIKCRRRASKSDGGRFYAMLIDCMPVSTYLTAIPLAKR
jgi:hypothetical protein